MRALFYLSLAEAARSDKTDRCWAGFAVGIVNGPALLNPLLERAA
jgi:hypothetical protein